MRSASAVTATNESFWTANGSNVTARLQVGGTVMIGASNVVIGSITANGVPIANTAFSYINDEVSFNYVPAIGTVFAWSGTATQMVLDYQQTMLAQYANSPIMCSMIESFNDCMDPSVNIDAFFANVWDISQCVGIGLDIWGRIVNVPRNITLSASQSYLGYEEALPTSFTFNAEPMYTGPVQGTQFTLSDDAYRVLIMTKALANISSFTAPSVNKLLNFMFNGQGGPPRGSCYVLELSPMQIEYVFNFALTTWEASVLQQPILMPRPAGVGVSIIVNH